MPQIGTNPRGLISLLSLYQQGEVPRELDYVVKAMVDLTDMYLCDKSEAAVSTINPVAAGPNYGGTGDITVPQGEVWSVKAITSVLVTPAASAGTFAPALQIDGASFYLAPPVTNGASETKWNPGIITTPLWLKAGARVGIVVHQLTGAAVIGACGAIFTRLRA